MNYFLKYLKYKKKYLKQKDLQIGAESSQKCVFNDKHEIMENVCPGLKYFNEIKNGIEKNPDAIYLIFGHGCDLDEELLTVPDNRKYITRVACGITSMSDIDINIGNDFLNNTLDIHSFDKYEKVINDAQAGVVYYEEYKTHVSGQKYVNNKNSCFLDRTHGHGGLSGLRRLGDPVVSIPKLKNFNYRSEADRFTLREYLLMCYNCSLFPTTQQINKLLDETSIPNSHEKLASYDWNGWNLKEWEKLITENFSIDYASIIDVLPGTFINKACRPICKGKKTKEDFIGTTPFIQLARKNSDRKIYTELPKETQDKLNEYSDEAPMPISYIKEDLKKLDNP